MMAGIGASLLSYRSPLHADSGFDGCWRYTLAVASSLHLVFGRDLAYTYGPLGWIGAPIVSGYHVADLQLALPAVAIACGIAVVRLTAISARPSLALIVYTLAAGAFAWPALHGIIGIEPDYQLVFITLVAVLTTEPKSIWANPAFALAGCCAGLAIAIKTTAFIDIGAIIVFAIAPLVWSDARRALSLIGSTAVSFFVIAFVTLNDTSMHGAVQAFFENSIDIAVGYTGGMSDGQRANETHAAVGTIVICLALLICWGRAGRSRVAGICCSILIPGWKHTIVRQGVEHSVYLYATVALIAAYVIARSIRRRDVVVATVIGAAALIHLATLDSVNHLQTPPDVAGAAIRNPEPRWSGHTIDALPADSVTAILSDGIYRPLPMFQLMLAYTPLLDNLDAAALAARGADTILYRFTTIGNRYAFADAPLVIRGLLCRYRARGTVTSNDGRRFVELARSADNCRDRPLQVQTRRKLFLLPDTKRDNFIVARIDLELTPRGRMHSVLWRVTLPALKFTFTDGTSVIEQISAATASDGIVVDPAPTSQSDAEAMFRTRLQGNVSSLAVEPGQDYEVRSVAFLSTHRTLSQPHVAIVKANATTPD